MAQTVKTRTDTPQGSVRDDEVARFDALAADWWRPDGPMAPLHAMNPVRIGWIEARLPPVPPDRRLRILDLGCGAGLAAEALARAGHDVTGIDAAPAAIAAAQAHAAAEGVALTYRNTDAETLIAEGVCFDVVVSLEVIEHVAEPAAFLAMIARLLVPGGRAFVSTLNRTLRSLAIAKIGAEYIARLLPTGTHDWKRFLTPAELTRLAAGTGLRVSDLSGMVASSPTGRRTWQLSRDTSINYIAHLRA